MKKDKKNIFCSTAAKKIVSLLLFFLPIICLAQNDTVILADTLEPTVIEAPPVVEEESTEESRTVYEEQKQSKQYFLEKREFEGDSFTIEQRKVPEDQFKKMQQDDDFWYANSGVRIEKTEEPAEKRSYYVPLGQRPWFQTFLWIVIIGSFAAFVAIYLAGSNVGLFRRKPVAIASDTETDEIPEDIFAINYQKEIDKAAKNSNYRLAIRLMFLRLLKQMAEKNIIQYKQDKTNYDYLVQLQSTGYYTHFFRITRNYEYSWYGKFAVSEETYTIIRNDFDRFDRQFY